MPDAGAFVPAVDDIVRIAAIEHRVIRNLRITDGYADLSDAMRARTGDVANWCTFATWASRQAGTTIRGEDLMDRLERRLGGAAALMAPVQSLSRALLRKGLFERDTRLGRVVRAIHTPFDAFERASDHVAEGNLKVFAEIGDAFARYLATVPRDAAPDGPEFAAFAAALRPGPAPDGQDELREAFALYQRTGHEADAATRAAWIFLANLRIGLHEQTRLQPQIAAAVDAPIVTAGDLGVRVLHVLIPGSDRWPRLVKLPATTVVGWAAQAVRKVAVTLTREVVTESMMVLALPGRVLALGRTLDAPVPDVLARTLPPSVEAFVRAHDPCAPGADDCGARDWCDLPQRMHYILHLFRAFAVEPALFGRPFTPAQAARLQAGDIPDGDL